MKQHSNRVTTSRFAGMLAMTAALVIAVAGPSFASGSSTAGTSSEVPTIYIKGSTASSLHFVGPKTITEGEELKIVNQSNARKVGPQTFTLVEDSEVPKSKRDRELCLKKGHICKVIAGWHRIKGDGPAKVNPVEAGNEGWDTPGALKEKGDSWYTGTKPGASFQQQISAGATIAPVTLAFISAFDPELHGTIKVLPLR